MVMALESLTNLNARELREMVMGLRARITERDVQIVHHVSTIARKNGEILYRQTKIDQLTHEMAVLKRLASSAAAASSSIRPRPACSMTPSMQTSLPSSRSCKV